MLAENRSGTGFSGPVGLEMRVNISNDNFIATLESKSARAFRIRNDVDVGVAGLLVHYV
jgi:hypothetical protein